MSEGDASARSIIDRATVGTLPATDPNLAAAAGDCDHENHIGDPVDEDPDVLAALATIDGQAG